MSKTIIGDPHAMEKNLDKIDILINIAEDLGNPVVVLGDFLHNKSIIRGKVQNYLYKRVKKSPLHWIFLVGNHEWFNLQCEDHSLQTLKELENVTIVDKLLVVDDTAYLPYLPPDRMLKALKEIPKGVKYLFCHADVVGFDYGNGILSQEGLKVKDLKRFELVISGHYHAYQEKKPLIYLGTPFSHTFGETDQDKFIGVFEEGNLELLKSPFPRHRTFEVDCNEQESFEWDSGDIVRMFLYGSPEAIAAYPRQDGVKYIERPSADIVEDSIVDETQSTAVQFENWARKIKGIEDEAIILKGIKLLEEVSQ